MRPGLRDDFQAEIVSLTRIRYSGFRILVMDLEYALYRLPHSEMWNTSCSPESGACLV